MNKYLKAIGIALGVIILIMLVTPLLFKGKIRDLAVKQANRYVNADVELGDIRISLFRSFPKVYIGLEQLILINREPFKGDTLANIDELALTIDLPDLFNGSPYTIDRIRVYRPDLRLRIGADGNANWDILPEKSGEASKEKSSESDSILLHVTSLKIRNGKLHYDDPELKLYLALDGMDLSMSGDLTADQTKLNTNIYVHQAYLEYAGIPYLVENQVALNATLDADFKNSIYRFEDNYLKINDLILNFQGSVGGVGEELNMLLTFNSPQNSFKNVLSLVPAIYSRDFSSVETDGSFTMEGFIRGTYSDDKLPAFEVGLDVKDAWFQYPELPESVKDINFQAIIENPGGDADNTLIDISKFSFTLIDKPFNGSMRLANPVSDPEIDLNASGILDLNSVEKVYPLQGDESLSGLVDAKVTLRGKLSDVETGNYTAVHATGYILMNELVYRSGLSDYPLEIVSGQLNVSPAYLDLVMMEATIGNSDFKASGRIEDYLSYFLGEGKFKGDFLLNAGRIDLNDWIYAATENEDPSEVTISGLPDTALTSSYLIPSVLELKFNTSINTLVYQTIEMKEVSGNIEIANSRLVLEGLTADMFGGEILFNGFYDSADPVAPKVDFVMGLNKADIGEMVSHIPAMERYAPIASKVAGKLTGNINLASVLDESMMPLYETVKGLGNVKTGFLEVQGVNTLNALSDALQIESLKGLQIDPLNLSFQVMEGRLNVKPFDFKTGNIVMNLGGWTSVSEEIGYILDMKVPRDAFGASASSVLNNLANQANQMGIDMKIGDIIELKTLITGTLDDPKLKIDLVGTGKGIIEEAKKTIEEGVATKIDEEAKKILLEAQARADAILSKAQEEADKLMVNANKLAEETRNQVNQNAAKIEKEAEDKGSLAKLAAKKAADEVRKEGDKQANNIVNEAKKQSDKILEKAKQESDKILQEARDKAASLNE